MNIVPKQYKIRVKKEVLYEVTLDALCLDDAKWAAEAMVEDDSPRPKRLHTKISSTLLSKEEAEKLHTEIGALGKLLENNPDLKEKLRAEIEKRRLSGE